MKFIIPLLSMFILQIPSAGKNEDLSLRPVFLLNSRDIGNLQQLISTDEDARLAFEPVLDEADQAMKENPDPVDTIFYEGLVDFDPLRVKTKESLMDVNKSNVMAYAYVVTGDKKYARKVIAYTLAWADRYKPDGNPINENKLTPLMAAYGMVMGITAPGEKEKINSWLLKIGKKNIEKGYEGETGNWKSKRLKIVGLAGLIIENEFFMEYARQGLVDYIEKNFYDDGTTYDLRHRDALSYHCGGINPVLSILILMRHIYPDLYGTPNSQGGSVKKSVEFLLPYANGEKVYPQWVNSRVEFDRKRYEAGDEKYKPGTLWDPESGMDTYVYAQFFDERFVDIIRKFTDSPNEKYPSWETVLAASMRPNSGNHSR